MDYYTPLFSKIVNSSLWLEPDWVCKLFLTMLAIKDRDFVVRYNSFALAKICWPKELPGGVAERRVMDGLEILQSPDTSRVEPQPFDGRRIQRHKDGWLILNGDHYQREMRKRNQAARNADRQRNWRERRKASKQPHGDESFEESTEVSAAYRSRERRGVSALERDDQKGFDQASSEGVPDE